MRRIKFNEDREFTYTAGLVHHKAGDVLAVHDGEEDVKTDPKGRVFSLRSDKAQRWVTRGAAEMQPETRPAEAADDKPVDGAANVVGKDGGDPGQRPVDVKPGGGPGAAAPAAAAAKPGSSGHK